MSSMTSAAQSRTRWRPPEVLTTTGRWLGDRLFGFGLESRIRLGGLSPAVRRTTVIGLTGTIGLLVLLLHPSAVLFGSPQFTASLGIRPASAPQFLKATTGLISITLVGLGLAWGILLLGVSECSGSVRLVAAVVFVALNSFTAVHAYHYYSQGSLLPAERAIVEVLLITGFWIVPVSLVAGILLDRSRAGPATRAARLSRFVPSLGVMVLFGTMLWVGSTSADIRPTFVLASVDSALASLAAGLVPLVVLSGFALFRFAYGAGASVSHWTRRLSRRLLLPLVGVAIFGEGAWLLVTDGHRVTTPLRTPGVLIEVIPALAGFGALAYFTRSGEHEPTELEQESMTLLAAALIAIPIVGAIIVASPPLLFQAIPVLNSHTAVYQHVFHDAALWWTRAFGAGHKPWGEIVTFSPIVVVSAIVARRSEVDRRTRQLALGLLIIIGWYLLYSTSVAAGNSAAVLPNASDVTVFAALLTVTAFLIVRRQRIEDTELAWILGLLVVAALLDTNLSILTTIGNWLGLHHNVIFVLGVAFTLLGRSQFTSGNSRRLPRRARPLLWTGYLILALLVFLWREDAPGFASVNFVVNAELPILGVPYVAWLLVTGRFREPSGALSHGKQDLPSGPSPVAQRA